MAKLKTNRAAAKRFRFTGTSRIRRSQAFVNHILTKKSSKRKRGLRRCTLVSKSDEKELRRLLPYGA